MSQESPELIGRLIEAVKRGSFTEQEAIDLFGYRWVSFIGVPIKGTAGYPRVCRVRQLLSARQLDHPSWQRMLAEKDGGESDGTEPLSYSYCSSQGTNVPPPSVELVARELIVSYGDVILRHLRENTAP